MLKPETLNPIPVPTVCGHCGVEERHLLLQIRYRSFFRRLCTTCVLRLHPQSFCPTCYVFYASPPPPDPEFVNCTKCYSASHSRCAAATMGPYVCPLCVNPNSPIFVTRKSKDGRREIDNKAGKVLLTAALIAASTMEKAAEGAKAEAEKRAKEAAFTRKRAKEALEHVAALEVGERLKRKEISSSPAEASGSGMASVPDKNQKTCNATNNNSFVPKNPVMVSDPNRIPNQIGVDGPNEVSARLNAVGLREKERFPAATAAFRGPLATASAPKSNGTVMTMEEKERARVLPAHNVGGSINNTGGLKPSNGLYSVRPAVERPQHMQSFNVKEENAGPQ